MKTTIPFETLTNSNVYVEKLYGSAMQITDQEEADDYLELLINYNVLHYKQTREFAEQIVKKNLGYYAGYFQRITQERVFKLFKTKHPIFGLKEPTCEEAFNLGMKMGEEAKLKNQS